MRIAIVGFGQEGRAAFDYYSNQGHEITIVDESESPKFTVPDTAQVILGADALKKLQDFDLVIRTPQIRPDRLLTTGKIWSATNEFFDKCPAVIIGVTGTKGKGTTSTLITKILEATQKKVHLVGNIGVPAIEELKHIESNDVVVFELSSFQLWDLKKSPHIGVWLMMAPDHMDVHISMDEYVAAKQNITAHQGTDDVLVYHPTNQFIQQAVEGSNAKKIPFMESPGAYIENGNIVIDGHIVCETDDVGLRGAHNLENVTAAITACWELTQDISKIREVISGFKGMEHRLEFVATVDGVDYFNDSYSSVPAATIAGMRAFPDRHVVAIFGGSDKKVDLSEIAVTAKSVNLKKAILIGETGPLIAKEMDKIGYSHYVVSSSKDISEITSSAQGFANSGDVVLLSPGCASFDMFANFKERGELFKTAVKSL